MRRRLHDTIHTTIPKTRVYEALYVFDYIADYNVNTGVIRQVETLQSKQPMKCKALLTCLLLGLLSCNNPKMDKTERASEPTIYSTQDDDQEMNRAIELAGKTLNQFDSAFNNKNYDSGTIALKIKFPTENGFEHIWATQLSLENGTYFGVIDNLPNNAKDVQLGDKIKINKDEITDWMFGRNGKLVGGYTIRTIRNRMTEQEKIDFDAGFPLRIDY